LAFEPAGATKQLPSRSHSTRAPRHHLLETFILSTNTLIPPYTVSITPTVSKMGWLPWSSGDSNKASDGGRIAPDRTSRARCWEGRDHFFACLDRNDILDGIKNDKEARQKCAKEVAEFEAACSKTWVRTVLAFLRVDLASEYFRSAAPWHFDSIDILTRLAFSRSNTSRKSV
jgi:hypothetical protein